MRLGATLWLCLSSCAPTPVADPLGVMSDRTRDPAQRLAAADLLGPIRDAPDPQAAAASMHRILWSDAQPTDLRLLALGRLIGYDADAFWRTAERRIVEVDLWPVLGPLIEKSADRGDPAFTPALVRSYARASRIIPDSERPERDAIAALNPGRTVEQAVWDVLVSDDESVGTATRVDAWALSNRLSGPTRAGALLLGESSVQPLVLDLRDADWLGVLPDNREGVLWLMRLRGGPNRAFWAAARSRAVGLTEEQRLGLELRHLPILVHASEQQLAVDRHRLVTRLKVRLSAQPAAIRSTAGLARELPSETFESHIRSMCWADLLTVEYLLDAVQDRSLVHELFRQADADLADTSTEHGGVLVIEDGRFIALPFLPVIRAHDQKFYSSDALIERMYTGLFHYHFHAQQYVNAEYAGPGVGDLGFVDRLRASAVVFTFLDRATLGVDYYQPGGVVIDLGVVRR